MKIKAHKGGRTARIGARLTAEEKAAVMAKVKADGFKSFSDWLMAQIKLTQRAPDRLAAWAGCVNFYQCYLAGDGSVYHRRQVTQAVGMPKQ